jgi:hypothetical protein
MRRFDPVAEAAKAYRRGRRDELAGELMRAGWRLTATRSFTVRGRTIAEGAEVSLTVLDQGAALLEDGAVRWKAPEQTNK